MEDIWAEKNFQQIYSNKSLHEHWGYRPNNIQQKCPEQRGSCERHPLHQRQSSSQERGFFRPDTIGRVPDKSLGQEGGVLWQWHRGC